MKRKSIAHLALLLVLIVLGWGCTNGSDQNFIRVEDGEFIDNGESYNFVGTNFWYGAYLGQEGEAGNRERLKKELDFLVENGITNLRVLGASEEASFENSLEPVFIRKDGSFNESLMVGMDYLLSEMGKRDMKAVIFLNNYWEWSGGMSTYNGWFGMGPVIDPADGDWTAFMKFSAKFYQNEEANELYRKYIKTLIERENTVNQKEYRNDPTIMAWQLANEPRPGQGAGSIPDIPHYYEWINETAAFIKKHDANHMVSTGSEGAAGSLDSLEVFKVAHNTENIDYLTFHMWAKNWGWIDPANMDGTFEQTLQNAEAYIKDHLAVAEELNKPIVMEEFGFPRDGEQYAPDSPVTYRNRYYKMIFKKIEANPYFAGSNFWSWGGFGEAQNTEDFWWRPGDPFTGDPPQEPQGLNSVFATDSTTLKIIRNHAEKL